MTNQTPSNSVVTDAEFLRAIGLAVRTKEAQARLEEIANRLDAMRSANPTGSDELVERKWLEIRENLNRLHSEGAITYGELKHGVNSAALMRDAAFEALNAIATPDTDNLDRQFNDALDELEDDLKHQTTGVLDDEFSDHTIEVRAVALFEIIQYCRGR